MLDSRFSKPRHRGSWSVWSNLENLEYVTSIVETTWSLYYLFLCIVRCSFLFSCLPGGGGAWRRFMRPKFPPSACRMSWRFALLLCCLKIYVNLICVLRFSSFGQGPMPLGRLIIRMSLVLHSLVKTLWHHRKLDKPYNQRPPRNWRRIFSRWQCSQKTAPWRNRVSHCVTRR